MSAGTGGRDGGPDDRGLRDRPPHSGHRRLADRDHGDPVHRRGRGSGGGRGSGRPWWRARHPRDRPAGPDCDGRPGQRGGADRRQCVRPRGSRRCDGDPGGAGAWLAGRTGRRRTDRPGGGDLRSRSGRRPDASTGCRVRASRCGLCNRGRAGPRLRRSGRRCRLWRPEGRLRLRRKGGRRGLGRRGGGRERRGFRGRSAQRSTARRSDRPVVGSDRSRTRCVGSRRRASWTAAEHDHRRGAHRRRPDEGPSNPARLDRATTGWPGRSHPCT